MRIPFNHIDSNRNYLSKLIRYDRLLNVTNSISHLDDFVRVCWETWRRRVPFGIYNVTNTGSITTREATELIKTHREPDRIFEFFENEEEFMRLAAKTPRSSCVLDNSKLRATGIQISDVGDAIERALKKWVPATATFPAPQFPHNEVRIATLNR
jgi:UDP-glucose 4,6-dehydratase